MPTGRDRLTEHAGDLLRDAVREVQPRLRGWLHLATFPLCILGGVVLFDLSPDTRTRVATGVFTATAALLFGISALFHRGHWSPRWHGVLRRLDHSNIFLLIAGTYTPFALTLLDGTSARLLLTLVWGGALVGIAFRVLWVGAPRWLYLPVYVALGWSALPWLRDFASAGPAVLTFILLGGGLYSVGALVYGLRRPNPFPRWFGYHEVFHSLTIAAFAAHYVGLSLLLSANR